MIPVLLKLALGGLNLIKVVTAALRRFFAKLDIQGWLGLAASILLGFVWLHAAGEARHWQKQSGQFEKLWSAEKLAHVQTVANYRAAAERARQAFGGPEWSWRITASYHRSKSRVARPAMNHTKARRKERSHEGSA